MRSGRAPRAGTCVPVELAWLYHLPACGCVSPTWNPLHKVLNVHISDPTIPDLGVCAKAFMEKYTKMFVQGHLSQCCLL